MVICILNQVRVKFSRLKRFTLIGLGFLLALLNISILHADDIAMPSYSWGRGYHIPAVNLTLGGYFKASYSYLQPADNELALEDLSFFISWRPFNRVHFFSELELEDLFSLEGVRPFEESFRVERLYVDFMATDYLTLRLGQFLTPFSRWSLLHAAPLVWTSSRPLITEGYVVSHHATGLEVLYRTYLFERELNVSVYADDSNDLEIGYHINPFIYAFGARLTYQAHNTLNIGTSYLVSKVNSGGEANWQYSFALDFLWQKQQYEVQLESLLNIRTNQGPQYGVYLQSVAPILDTLFAVARYEYMFDSDLQQFDAPEQNHHTHVGVIGLTWRPAAPLALKIEYRFGHNNEDNAPSGLLTSISMFF